MNSQEEYLTKRVVVRATKKGMKIAAKETMDIMGYNVIALNGWVVKKFKDGTIERIKEIKSSSNLGPLALD
ncbi:hypothetical protein [Mucilaginibacter xinganensis]|uniref:Uncharacterized protein n=1 Tax=Mucilaginibacter xinganensis TaxID=1234841 RepID=A0A223NUH2_9SPHI|nr:hypothetical protein [Mucilaginibacter xinganensis]ASU33324.1 hypothetical protein MuYL_1426 [Mucilaginibacter xinganensis]